MDCKYKILFLPYKVSMWDAMDSIYKAACNDSRCQVKVVSIPYYQMEDGGTKKLVCEQGLYPKDIQVTPYGKYSLEEEKPDIIFIHNPYDNTNNITQVLEAYYSRELVKHTKHLVYIPYFVVKNGGGLGEHFCVLPGVYNSWKTIVQSETIREKYLAFHPQNKIVALGSPKFDFIRREKVDEIPDDWKRKIQEKKVFLYNIHLESVFREDLLEQIDVIMTQFQRRQKSVLLWRPHPLMNSMVQKRGHEFFQNYSRRIEKAKADSNIIVDETEDIDRAIMLADAYIGDINSSIVQMFGLTGKPILEYKKAMRRADQCIQTMSAVVLDKHIWMTDRCDNVLYKISITDGSVVGIYEIEAENENKPNLFLRFAKTDQKIYFIPLMAKNIAVVDVVEGQMNYINLALECSGSGYNAVIYNDKLWLFPICFTNEMYCINLNDNLITVMESEFKLNLPSFINYGEYPLFYGNTVIDGKIYRVCQVMPIISEYSMETGIFDYIEVPYGKQGLHSITYDGDQVWILPRYGDEVICGYLSANRYMVISFTSGNQNNDNRERYADICFYNNAVWLFPVNGGNIVKIDTNSYQVEIIEGLGEEEKYQLYDGYDMEEGKIYLFPYEGYQLAVIDTEDNTVNKIEIKKDIAGYEKMKRRSRGDIDKYIYRSEGCSLDHFIDIVEKDEDKFRIERVKAFKEGIANIDRNAGSEIWNYLISEIQKE